MEVFGMKNSRAVRLWLGSYAVQVMRHWVKGRSVACMPGCRLCKAKYFVAPCWYVPVMLYDGPVVGWRYKILSTAFSEWLDGHAGAIIDLEQPKPRLAPVVKIVKGYHGSFPAAIEPVIATINRMFGMNQIPFTVVTITANPTALAEYEKTRPSTQTAAATGNAAATADLEGMSHGYWHNWYDESKANMTA